MNIGLLTTSFPRYEEDIAGHFVLGFARTLVGLGHRVEVLAPEPVSGGPAPGWRNLSVRWVAYIRPRGLERTFYGAGVPDNLARSVAPWLGLAPFVAALANETRKARRDWDLLISHWALPCALVAGALREARPHVAVFHSADIHVLKRLPGRALIARAIGRGANKLMFVAPALRDLFLEILPQNERSALSPRCHVFPMGIDPIAAPSASRKALRERYGFERFTLLSIGRLVEIKGIGDAIHAVAGRRDLELVVVGEGPVRPALEKLAGDHQTPVRFLGKVTGSAKNDLLEAADAFIHTSRILDSGRTEGMPTVLIEAMAHGLPIIATDVGGVSSVLTHMRTAILVPPQDPSALSASLDLLVRDHALRSRLEVQSELISRDLVWPSLAGQLKSLIEI
jgi:glycosyltransferase involved in cell wall biosynthesis